MTRNTRYFFTGRKFLFIALVVIAVGGYSAWRAQWRPFSHDASPNTSLSTANVAPPSIGFLTPDGRKFDASEFRGKVVIVHFWAMWCAPCAEEMPKLLKLAEELGDAAIQIVAVSLDPRWEDSKPLLAGRDEKFKHWRNAWDPKMKTAEAFGSFQFPETYILGPSGAVVTKWVGPQDWQRAELKAFLLRLLK
jgi:thiol-disulfide isomerase/thioredoxin